MKIITALILSLFVFNAHAFFKDGNLLVLKMREFEKAIKSDPSANYQDAVEYRSYVIGIFDSLSLRKRICFNNVQTGQIAEVVAKYLNDNPAKRSEPAYYLVEESLLVAFPCRK